MNLLLAMTRFFNPGVESRLDVVESEENDCMLPSHMSEVIKFDVLTGLRPSEAVESVKLLNLSPKIGANLGQYYDEKDIF